MAHFPLAMALPVTLEFDAKQRVSSLTIHVPPLADPRSEAKVQRLLRVFLDNDKPDAIILMMSKHEVELRGLTPAENNRLTVLISQLDGRVRTRVWTNLCLALGMVDMEIARRHVEGKTLDAVQAIKDKERADAWQIRRAEASLREEEEQ